jgi:hypothetical protein
MRIAGHLMQLTGMALMVAALVLFSQKMTEGQPKVVAILGEIGDGIAICVKNNQPNGAIFEITLPAATTTTD